jgi:hypothetical protein
MKVIIKPAAAVKLSPHFYLSEFVESETAQRRGIDNNPSPTDLANLFKLAAMLEQVRSLLGNKVITVTSGYRGPALNKAVGGAATSDHQTGEAVDFKCHSFGTPLDVSRAIAASTIEFGQLIWEFGSWIHISLPNRGVKNGEVLTARRVEKRTVYTKGLTP